MVPALSNPLHILLLQYYAGSNFRANLHDLAIAECLLKSIFSDFLIFAVADQGKHAASIGAICLFIGYLENAKHPPNKNCVSCSKHKIVWKLFGVKMMSHFQKHKIVMKVAYLDVSKFHISFKGIKSSGKLPILVKENCVSLE